MCRSKAVAAATEAGFSDVVAPPTFAVVIAQRCEAQYVSDPDAGHGWLLALERG